MARNSQGKSQAKQSQSRMAQSQQGGAGLRSAAESEAAQASMAPAGDSLQQALSAEARKQSAESWSQSQQRAASLKSAAESEAAQASMVSAGSPLQQALSAEARKQSAESRSQSQQRAAAEAAAAQASAQSADAPRQQAPSAQARKQAAESRSQSQQSIAGLKSAAEAAAAQASVESAGPPQQQAPSAQARKQRAKSWLQSQQGITGLETAIVLIAFVVVSSVFAFAALSTGLFTSDKSKETIHAGLSEARGTLELRGSVIAEDTDSSGAVDKIYLQVANAAGGENIDLTPGSLVIRYQDANQAVVFDTSAELTVAGVGNADADLLLEPGEIYQITMNSLQANLNPDLGTSTTFTLQVLPPKGASLNLERTTPVLLDVANDLK